MLAAMPRVRSIVVAALLLCAASCRSSPAPTSREAAAQIAAEKWLALVDAEKYDESWREASAYFRGAVSQETWRESITGVRKPLGAVNKRTLKSARFTRELPGAPDG